MSPDIIVAVGQQIVGFILGLVSIGLAGAVGMIIKNRIDINAAHHKIRQMEGNQYGRRKGI